MRNGKSLKVNFVMNCILTLSSIIFPLISFPYVSRVLSPSGIGRVSFATSVISYFSMLAQMGIPTYGIRTCSKIRDNRRQLNTTVREILTINLILCIIVYLVFFSLLFTIPRFSEDRILLIIVSTSIGFNALGVEWLYRALEEYTYISIRSILFKFLALILMLALIHNSEDYLIYGALTIFAAVGSNILNFVNLRKHVNLRDCNSLNIKQHLKPISVFFGMSIAATIYSNMDTVMLGFMKTNDEVGLYNAAVKMKSVLVSVVTSLGAVLLPRASYYYERGLKKEFLDITRKGLNFVFIAAGSLMAFFMLFSRESILVLSGAEFERATPAMTLIMPTLLLVGTSNIIGLQMLVPMGKEKLVLYSEIAGAVVNIIVNAILIPRISSAGAAIGTVAAELVVVIVQIYYLKDIIFDDLKQIQIIKITVSIILSSIVSYWVKYLNMGNFMTLFIAAIVFYMTMAFLLIFLKEKFINENVIPSLKSVLSRILRRSKNR